MFVRRLRRLSLLRIVIARNPEPALYSADEVLMDSRLHANDIVYDSQE